MTNKEHILKYGGESSISSGGVWTMPDGRSVHFTLNPKMGCRGADIAVGFHGPGRKFAPHKRPVSKEILIIHSGKSGRYLYDKWIPVETGDIVFAPPGVLRGIRDPAGNTEDFVTLSITAPLQLDLYLRTGYDILEGNSGKCVEGV